MCATVWCYYGVKESFGSRLPACVHIHVFRVGLEEYAPNTHSKLPYCMNRTESPSYKITKPTFIQFTSM